MKINKILSNLDVLVSEEELRIARYGLLNALGNFVISIPLWLIASPLNLKAELLVIVIGLYFIVNQEGSSHCDTRLKCYIKTSIFIVGLTWILFFLNYQNRGLLFNLSNLVILVGTYTYCNCNAVKKNGLYFLTYIGLLFIGIFLDRTITFLLISLSAVYLAEKDVNPLENSKTRGYFI